MKENRRIRCWASCLGDCSTSSREHVISKAVLLAGGKGPLVAEGLSRIPDGQYDVGALVARVLCAKHNSALTDLDAHIGKLSSYLHELHAKPATEPFVLDGPKLERWACKTVVSFLVAGWSGGSRRGVDESLVRYVFGLAPPPGGVALFSVHSAPIDAKSSIEIHVQVLWSGRAEGEYGEAAGAFLSINGLRFFLTLTESGASEIRAGGARLQLPETSFRERPIGVSVSSDSGPLGTVLLNWAR